jgi:hypothetical protein
MIKKRHSSNIIKKWNTIIAVGLVASFIFIFFGFYILLEIKDSKYVKYDGVLNNQGSDYLNEYEIEGVYDLFRQREENTSKILNS